MEAVEEVEVEGGGGGGWSYLDHLGPMSPLYLPVSPCISLYLLGHLGLHAAHLAQREGARSLRVEARALGETGEIYGDIGEI